MREEDDGTTRYSPQEVADLLTDGDAAYMPTLAEAAAALATAAGLTVSHTPPTAGAIYGALIQAMREVGAVAKLGKYSDNKGTQYNFRGVDAVVNAVGPALREAGVLPVPLVDTIVRTPGSTQSGGSKLHLVARVTYRFTASDGSHLDVIVEGEASDTSDKGTGKVMSVAYRIALLQLFAIPTDDVDPDATRIEGNHTPPMSAALVAYIARAAQFYPVEGLEPVWRLLVAHVPADATIPGEANGQVWWELFAERYRREVGACPGKDDLADLWKRLGQFGRTFRVGDGGDVGNLITSRGVALSNENKQALQEVRDLIEDAYEAIEVDHAAEVLRVHLTNHRISAADAMTFSERMAARREEIKVAEAEAAREAMGEPDDTQERMNEEQRS